MATEVEKCESEAISICGKDAKPTGRLRMFRKLDPTLMGAYTDMLQHEWSGRLGECWLNIPAQMG